MVVGEFGTAPVDFGGGPVVPNGSYSIYVLRTTTDGAFVSLLQSSGPNEWGVNHISGVEIDGEGALRLGGWLNGSISFGGPPIHGGGQQDYDAFLVALAADQSPLWASAHGSEGQYHWQFIDDLAGDAAGRLAVIGNFRGNIEFGDQSLIAGADPNYDAFVVKLGPGGEPLWTQTIGSSGDQRGSRTAIDAAGHVWAAGTFTGELEIGGELFTSLERDPYLIKYCP